jgi:cytochrome P450
MNGCSPDEMKESTRQIAAGYPWPGLVTGPLISQFCYAIPSMVLAHWLGIAKQDWPDLIQAVNAFVRCVAPGGTDSEYKAGIQAAIVLENLIHQQLSKPGPLLGSLLAEVEQKGFGADWVVANAIGLLFQANEGCAGLIAQTLILADQHGNEMGIAELIALALQENPPIQNTRRFAATDQVISGCPVQAGQTVLAILAAKDGAGSNNAFGFAAHACPGEYWARSVAEAAVEYILQLDFDRSILRTCGYRRSLNARVPEFTGGNRP